LLPKVIRITLPVSRSGASVMPPVPINPVKWGFGYSGNTTSRALEASPSAATRMPKSCEVPSFSCSRTPSGHAATSVTCAWNRRSTPAVRALASRISASRPRRMVMLAAPNAASWSDCAAKARRLPLAFRISMPVVSMPLALTAW
jgi:hypothetical protein